MENVQNPDTSTLFETIWFGTLLKDEQHMTNLRTKFLANLDLKFKSRQHILDLIKSKQSDLEIIQDFKSVFGWFSADEEITQKFQKSSQLSAKFREKGNNEYKNGKIIKAMRAYNLAIVFGRPQSEELGLAFGNRSAILVFMNEPTLAMQDLDLAIANNIPIRLHEKLEQRRQKCLDSVNGQCSTHKIDRSLMTSRLFTLKHPNEKVVVVENFVEIIYNEITGRQLVATKDIPAGTVLAVEQPYVTVLEKEFEWDLEHCHYCFKRNPAGIPCSICTFSMFCDTQCLEKAMSSSHQYDHHTFSYFHSHEVLHYSDLMSLRILTKTGPKILYQKYLESCSTNQCKKTENDIGHGSKIVGSNSQGVYESSYLQIYNLISHRCATTDDEFNEIISNIFKALCLANLLNDLTDFFKNLDLEKSNTLSPDVEPSFLDFITSLLFHHLENIKFNAVSFSELHRVQMNNNESTISNSFAVGLFPTLSLANHSCCPSAIHVRNVHNLCLASLVAIKPLKSGEEITITYGPKFQNVKTTTIERQCELKRKYKFLCNCIACSRKWSFTSITTNVDEESIDLDYLTKNCTNCVGKSSNQFKCKECLAKIFYLNAEIDKYEQQLRSIYNDVIPSGSEGIVDAGNDAGNNEDSADYYWTIMEKLKPCMQFFGTYFLPTFNLCQIGQDLYKRVVVNYVLSQNGKNGFKNAT